MKMKKYESFDLWAEDQADKFQRVIKTLRKMVKKAVPALEETVKWGNGCWTRKDRPVAYLYADKDHLQFGFFHGTALPDPKGLLIGKGAYVRHVKIRKTGDIDSTLLGRWLRRAAKG